MISTDTADLKERILEKFIEFQLEKGEAPKSVYAFCKDIGISESDFYEYFSSFDQLNKAFWQCVFEKVTSRMLDSEEYNEFNSREKLLSFYFSFFEELKKHRSYILLKKDNPLSDIGHTSKSTKAMKKAYSNWIKDIVREGINSDEIADRSKVSDYYPHFFWMQFMFLLDFWKKDSSKAFEKTDEAIEKSVNLSFDLIEKNALESAFDFGKFIFQNVKS